MKELQTTTRPRVVLLYRNSSKKQTEQVQDAEGNIINDIPLQRRILRPWADNLGIFIREFVEGGISGYKVSASDRDAIQDIKGMADRGEFDILGIYMSERLGRIADETPLIVSYLNSRGIKVMSYSDGEISTKTHADKLMTYIRYWQAEGESLKTSIRIRDAQKDSVEQGIWRGGCPPYGYRSVSRGTLNPKGKPIFDVEIDPEQGEIVRTIFRLYGRENYGSKNIAKLLNDKGIPTRHGGEWTGQLIMVLIKNKTYMGVYELGRYKKKTESLTVSPPMEFLKIVEPEDYWAAQEVRKLNTKNADAARPTVRGSLLLTGMLYCECGRKFTSQYFSSEKQRADGTVWRYDRKVYRCSSFAFPKEGRPRCFSKLYTAEELEALIIRHVKKFILTLDREKLLTSEENKIREEEHDMAEKLKKLTRERVQKEKEIQRLKEEVMKVLLGESKFSQNLLNEMLDEKEIEMAELNKKHESTTIAAETLDEILATRKAACEELDNWSDRFDAQDTAGKKAMLINIIEKITVLPEKAEVKFSIRYDETEEDDIDDHILIDESEENAIMSGGNSPQYSQNTIISTNNAFFSSKFVNRGELPKSPHA